MLVVSSPINTMLTVVHVCVCLCVFVMVMVSVAVDNSGCTVPTDGSNSCDIWLSLKSTVDNKSSVFIYSYEEHECVGAKV